MVGKVNLFHLRNFSVNSSTPLLRHSMQHSLAHSLLRVMARSGCARLIDRLDSSTDLSGMPTHFLDTPPGEWEELDDSPLKSQTKDHESCLINSQTEVLK